MKAARFMTEVIFVLKISLNQKSLPHCRYKGGLVWNLWYRFARIYGRAIFIPPCGHPHPISGESAPITMGHEFSGVVYAVGEGVDDIEIGQHVVVEPYIVADDVPTGPGDNYHLSKI